MVKQCLEIERLRRTNELLEAELSGYRAICEEDIALAIRRMLAEKEEGCEHAAVEDVR